MVDEAEVKLKHSGRHVCFLKDQVSEKDNQSIEKNEYWCWYQQFVLVLEPRPESAPLTLVLLVNSIQRRKISSKVSLWLVLSTRRQHSSVPRRIPKIVRKDCLIMKFWKPNYASFRQICIPRLIKFRRFIRKYKTH